MNGPMNDENAAKAKEMAELVELLLEEDEADRLQRSHVCWLTQGDRNWCSYVNSPDNRGFNWLANLA
jgi:hypothetical protein